MWSPQGRLTWLFCQMASKDLRIKQSLFLHWGLSTEAFIMSFYYLIKENANFAWCHLWIVLLQKIISRSFQFSKKIFFFFSFPSLGSQTSCWERRSTQGLLVRFEATLLREPHFPECTSSNTSAARLLVVTDADVKHLRRIGDPQAVKQTDFREEKATRSLKGSAQRRQWSVKYFIRLLYCLKCFLIWSNI